MTKYIKHKFFLNQLKIDVTNFVDIYFINEKY